MKERTETRRRKIYTRGGRSAHITLGDFFFLGGGVGRNEWKMWKIQIKENEKNLHRHQDGTMTHTNNSL